MLYRAPAISSHHTEQFICWKEVEAAFCPAPRGLAERLVVGSEPVHEEAGTAWQSSAWASRAAWSTSPSQIKLLQSLRSPFQHGFFPAASISQAKMGWGGGVRYCNLFPPAVTAYTWLLSDRGGFLEARVWPEKGSRAPHCSGVPSYQCTTPGTAGGAQAVLSTRAALLPSAEHPGFGRPARLSLPFFP